MIVSRAERLSQWSRRALVAVVAVGAMAQAVSARAAGDEPVAPLSLVPSAAMSANTPTQGDGLGGGLGTVPKSTDIPAPASSGGIVVNPLSEISLDAIGTLDESAGGFGPETWRGSNRFVIEHLLQRLPGDLPSRELRDLARRLLLSIAVPPAAGDEGTDGRDGRLLTLRVERLRAAGEIDGLNDLLAVVPNRADDESLARARIDGLLLAYDLKGACHYVRAGIASYHQVAYWQKAMAFCQMVGGELDKAMLGLDLLREQGAADDPAFLALASTAYGSKATLSPAMQLAPLHLAMARSTGTALPAEVIDSAGPGELAFLSRAPNADPLVRLRAAEIACAEGLVEARVLAEAYAAISFTPEDLGNAIAALDKLDGPRSRALLYQAVLREDLVATRAELLRVAFEEAAQDGLYEAAVDVFLPVLTEIPATPELAWFAATAGRALYAAGRYEQASAWLMLGRQESILDPQAQSAVATLWPYSRLAGAAALSNDGTLAAWRSVREGLGDETAARSQALLRAAFQALGEFDSMSWSRIAALGDATPAPPPDAALIYALEDASEARRLGETVLLSLIVLSEGGANGEGKTSLRQVHTLALGAALSALVRVGLRDEARALAIEAALALGV